MWHMYSLSTQGVEIKLIIALGEVVSRYGPIFKIAIFGHVEIWNLKTGPKVAYVRSFFPRGSKLRLFLLYGQSFSRKK